MDEVQRALALLEGDPAGALELCRRAWERTRDSVVGDLVCQLDDRVNPARVLAGKTIGDKAAAWLDLAEKRETADLATLLHGLCIGRAELARERIDAVARWPADPVTVSKLVAYLEDPPYPSQGALAFWEQLLEIVAKSGDLRACPRLDALDAKRWPGSEQMHRLMRKQIKLTVARLREGEKAAPLGRAAEQARDEMLRRMAPPASQRPGAIKRTEAELLDAIYADPRSEELRRVYGDVLSERGDSRGELIALQLEKTGELDGVAAKREVALVKKHAKAWLGPLGAVAADATFERGFADRIEYRGRYAAQLKAVTGVREWATVRALRMVEAQTRYGVVDLVCHPVMRSLEDVRGLDVEQVMEIAKRRPDLRALGFRVVNAAKPPGLDLEKFPMLEELEIESSEYKPAPYAWLQSSPILARLTNLVVQNGDGTFKSWLQAVQSSPKLQRVLVEPTLDSASGTTRFFLARGKTGRLDDLTVQSPARSFQSLPFRVTVEDAASDATVSALCKALEQLPSGAFASARVVVTQALWDRGKAKIEAAVAACNKRLGLADLPVEATNRPRAS